MSETSYFSRSWALLTRDKGWIKPLLVMTAATFVPIAGDLGTRGYALEWARLTAWGVDSAPKQKNVDVGKCIASGWRGFVVGLGWGLVLALCTSIIGGLAGQLPSFVGMLLALLINLALTAVSMIFGTLVNVAMLRSSIYEKIGAGYALSNIFEMVKRDFKGLLHIVLVSFVAGMIVSAVSMVFVMIVCVQLLPVIIAARNSDSSAILAPLSSCIGGVMFSVAVFAIVISFLANAISMILFACTGLWMRQFDIPSWGKSQDPLPEQGAPASSEHTYGYAAPPTAEPEPPANEPPAPAPNTYETHAPEPTNVASALGTSEPARVDAPQEGDVPADFATADEVAAAHDVVAFDEPVKDVDDLYADLYDVIQRNNRTDD